MLIAFLFAAASNLSAYWNSDKVVLSLCGALPVDAQSAPDLVHLIGELSREGVPPDAEVYIVDNAQPNAFATGRNPEHAAMCVTTGLLQRVDREELAGVLAHELSHVKNRDTLTMTLGPRLRAPWRCSPILRSSSAVEIATRSELSESFS